MIVSSLERSDTVVSDYLLYIMSLFFDACSKSCSKCAVETDFLCIAVQNKGLPLDFSVKYCSSMSSGCYLFTFLRMTSVES